MVGLLGVVIAGAALGQSAPVIPYPHPVISEVLYAVPSGVDADPNGDGRSDAVFDEFVEVINPHDRAIELKSYAIVDALGLEDPRDARAVVWVFPALTLGPGERAVVFNGRAGADASVWGGPSGAAKEKNPDFANAWTFSMGNTSKGAAFGNGRDLCALRAPDGTVVDVLVWGKAEEVKAMTPQGALRVAEVKASPRCSLARRDAWSAPEEHLRIDARLYSPGE